MKQTVHMTDKPFIHEDFLLQSQTARELYHNHAAGLPIIDYHCHLDPSEIAGDHNGNIVYLDQYVDTVDKMFFMRIEWELENFQIPQDKISEYFRILYSNKYGIKYHIYFSDKKPRMAIFVSKMSHCLYDLLARYEAGEMDVKIPYIPARIRE